MQSMNSLKDNDILVDLLKNSRTIAIVGLSPKEQRPSNMVGKYLIESGYTVYPVNPGQTEVLERKCYAAVSDINDKIDIFDLFRKAQDVLPIVEDIIKLPELPRAIWMQLGIVNEEAARLAESHGIIVIMDRCIKVDHQNLLK